MSSKTTFKRIALVAVAALGLGVLSVAPSSAAVNSDLLSVSAATAAQTTAETATATSVTTTLAFLAGAQNDSMSVTASLVSGPATSTALPFLALVETASASIDTNTASASGGNVVGAVTAPNVGSKVVNIAAGAAQVSAKYKVYLGTDSRTAPTVAGTYVVKLTPANISTGALNGTAQTITFTVAKDAGLDTVVSSATSILNTGETNTATTDATVLASKTASNSAAAATLIITTANAAGNETNVAESITVTITGAGVLGSGALSNIASITSVGRSIVVKKGDIVEVFPDGTAGVGTITVSSLAGKVLATETVTFYGDVAVIVASINTTILGVKNNAAAIGAVAYDASGYLVGGAVLKATSADTTIVSNSYSAATANTSATTGATTFDLTGVKAGTAKITVGLATSATDVTTTGYAIKSDAVTVTVGGGATEQADVIVGLDKQSYAPGSVAFITVTPVDKAGKALAPGTYTVFSSTGITTSQPLDSITAGSLVFTDVATVAKAVAATTDFAATPSNAVVYRVYLPKVEGDITFSYTTAALSKFPGNVANAGLARTITVNLSNPGSQAAVDAAVEATDAANAATDAALAAADAADAATAAAEDASAAVATLAKSVNTALANLKKQITALTALVNKLLKR
ncbi:hypothetical protein MCETARE7_00045 [Candidatus Nanopelagicaceae bacterium]